jgi:hypothetical protein
MTPTTEFCPLCAIKHLARAKARLAEARLGYPHEFFCALGEMSLAEDHLVEKEPALAASIRGHRKKLEDSPLGIVPFNDIILAVADATGYSVSALFASRGGIVKSFFKSILKLGCLVIAATAFGDGLRIESAHVDSVARPHATSAHSVTTNGGFQAGTGAAADTGAAVGKSASATAAGGAIGQDAVANHGGAVGFAAVTQDGGAIGQGAYAGYGGAVGFAAWADGGGAVGQETKTFEGFAGGKNAVCSTNGTYAALGINAVQLGTGSNTVPFSFKVYGYTMMNADGSIPIARTGVPGPGCTDLGDTNAVTITGATVSWEAQPTGVYTVSVAAAAARYCYALEVRSTNSCVLAAGISLQGTWTITGTNVLTLVPSTGTLWRAYGRGL